MQKLNHKSYLSLSKNSKSAELDDFNNKVLTLHDGTLLKLFPKKKLLSYTAILSCAKRFAYNAKKLEKLGIPCPKIIQVYRIPSIKYDAVHYQPIAGRSLRKIYKCDTEQHDYLTDKLLNFINHIQTHGVYFHSINLANIILTTESEFGLNDVLDVKFTWKVLNNWLPETDNRYIVNINKEQDRNLLKSSFFV